MTYDLTTIGEYATIQGGYAYKKDEFIKDGCFPVLKIKNIRNGFVSYNESSFISTKLAALTKKWMTKEGDVLISMTGSGPNAPGSLVGRVARVWGGEPPALINQRVGRLLMKLDGRIDPDFLFYVLMSAECQEYLVSNSTGSANQANISSKTIESFNCPRIDFTTSKIIADFLKLLDIRIRLLESTNITLESIAQALFKSWFVDFDPVRAKQEGRTPEGMDAATAALFPDSFEESELGLIPTGWTIEKLGNVTDCLRRGISPKYTEKGGITVINQKCIRNNTVDLTKARKHDFNQRKIAGRELKAGDILINSTGVGTLGRVAQIISMKDLLIVDSHVTVARAADILSWNYLGLELSRRQSEIEQLGEGSTGQTELNRGMLAMLRMIIPAPDILIAFDKIILPLRFKISLHAEHIQVLTELRDALLPRLISGELSLSTTPEINEELRSSYG